MKRLKSKKLVITISLLILILFISAITSPSKQDFISFDEKNAGVPLPESVRILEADFFFFSVYAPTRIDTIDEYGNVYLGFMGQFFLVKDGQSDESIWGKFLK